MNLPHSIVDFETKKPRWALAGLGFLCVFFLSNSIYCLFGFFYLLNSKIEWPLLVLAPLSFCFFYVLFFYFKKTKSTWGQVQIFDNPKLIVWSQGSVEVKKTGWNEVKGLKEKFLWYRKMPPRYGLVLIWNDNRETFLLKGDKDEVGEAKRKIEGIVQTI